MPRQKKQKVEDIPEMEAPEPESFSIHLPQQEVEITPAPFWKRTLAFIIDFALVYFVFFQLFMIIYASMTGLPIGGDVGALQSYMQLKPEISEKVFVTLVAGTFILLFYFTLMERVIGSTVGKKLLNLSVVSLHHNRINYVQAIIRNLTKSILLPLLVFDMIWIFFTKNKQRFSEIFAGTKVIYEPKLVLEYEVYE
jgi:uncharacterized RDD family membrane protein YckC